ncbi:MAG: spore germination protein GerW family protein [Anaerolineae bacterium]
MYLNRLFEVVEESRGAAQWQAAFGEPELAEGQVTIPVAKIRYGFGLGFGQSAEASSGDEGPEAADVGGGGGGSGSANPLGVIVVDADGVRFQEVLDTTKVVLAGVGLVALFILQFAVTLRAILRRG